MAKGDKRKAKKTKGPKRKPKKSSRKRPIKKLGGELIEQIKGTREENLKEKNTENKQEQIEESFNVFQKSKKKYDYKGLTIVTETNACILKKYEEINEAYLNNLGDKNQKKKYENIILRNMETTEKSKSNEYGERLFLMLTNNSLVQTTNFNNNIIKPNVIYNSHLNDEEFLTIVSDAKIYSFKTKTSEQSEIIRNKFINNKKYIVDLFNKERIIKDILENAILSVLINKFDDEELRNNFNYLSIDDASPCPLINLTFNYDNVNYNLNKESIKKEATSYIPLSIFQSTMKEFSIGYKLKKNELKSKIKEYIENHEIYFASLPDDIQGFTIHSGATFINLKYIREYFDINNQDKIIIIRTKIIQIYFHELNHGLLRFLDEDKKNDFFNNSKSKSSLKKSILQSIQKYSFVALPLDESGNFFDSLFYCGYYFEFIDLNIAKFYLKINTIKTIKDYTKKLKSIIKKINPNLEDKTFKFKMNYSTNFPQCAFSRMRMNHKELEQFCKTNEFKQFIKERLQKEEDDTDESMEDFNNE